MKNKALVIIAITVLMFFFGMVHLVSALNYFNCDSLEHIIVNYTSSEYNPSLEKTVYYPDNYKGVTESFRFLPYIEISYYIKTDNVTNFSENVIYLRNDYGSFIIVNDYFDGINFRVYEKDSNGGLMGYNETTISLSQGDSRDIKIYFEYVNSTYYVNINCSNSNVLRYEVVNIRNFYRMNMWIGLGILRPFTNPILRNFADSQRVSELFVSKLNVDERVVSYGYEGVVTLSETLPNFVKSSIGLLVSLFIANMVKRKSEYGELLVFPIALIITIIVMFDMYVILIYVIFICTHFILYLRG